MKKNEILLKCESAVVNDRLILDTDVKNLFMNDFIKLISEYFILNEKPILEAKKRGGELNINLNFNVCAVNRFNSIKL